MTFLKLEICIVWRSVIKFGVLCLDWASSFSPSFGGSKIFKSAFFVFFSTKCYVQRTLRFWALRSVFVVGLYRVLYACTIGTEIKVIRLLVRELWFLKCFLYLENYVFTCFLDFFFSFDHYKILESDHSAYEDSKNLYSQNTYDHYFTRNRSSKKLENKLCYFSYYQGVSLWYTSVKRIK